MLELKVDRLADELNSTTEIMETCGKSCLGEHCKVQRLRKRPGTVDTWHIHCRNGCNLEFKVERLIVELNSIKKPWKLVVGILGASIVWRIWQGCEKVLELPKRGVFIVRMGVI